MRRSLVVGNWKMHGSAASIDTLVTGLQQQLANLPADQTDIAVCPPFVFIPQVISQLEGSAIACGAQNVSDQQEGAYTGEISATMLAELGCQYVIVGHSERRTLMAESDADIAAKFTAVQSQGLTPILCVGESLAQREAGETLSWIEQQIKAVIAVAGIEAMAASVIAYEPIWAIGTGKTASPEQAQEVHAHIRQVLANESQAVAGALQLLYGGSVKADNAAELFGKQDIDGALVGGAALKAADFAAICMAATA
ncbi:triose-phosphate isomerase [Oceanicoccus sagamiensis]|uniref:Triosephosphate isomerase n=1 Tax=Oceanicoccus sagamiensis TaxID=716816 RepID=A0A1X9N5J5_9GAMM|nr:triose-phosphate isomerase [Oceanicoccus sagamiensis]ARN73006.1 triose-phosphate isomerase [Oceanicoccus sagamiensis]